MSLFVFACWFEWLRDTAGSQVSEPKILDEILRVESVSLLHPYSKLPRCLRDALDYGGIPEKSIAGLLLDL
jgi:hypothetical protein